MSEGIIAEPAENGEDAIDLAKHYDFDALILETRLPDLNDFEVISRLRAAMVRTPILILSSSTDVDDKVKALAAGADDYVTKPFHRAELIARIRAIIRRSKGHPESVIRTAGGLMLNFDTRSVAVGGRPLRLSGMEYSVLELLCLRKGTTLSKEMFLDHLYGGVDEPGLTAIDKFIHRLRKKISTATGGIHYIETVRGRGYVLRDPDAGPEPTLIDDSDRAARGWAEIPKAVGMAIRIIESDFLQRKFHADVFAEEKLAIFKDLKAQLTILLLMIEANETALLEMQLRTLGQYAITMQLFLHDKLDELANTRTDAIEQTTTLVEGSVVRTIGSGRFGPVDKTGDDPWISETTFRTDSFNKAADFAECLHKSRQRHQRLLCTLVFIIDVLKMLVAAFAQLVPLAGGKS